MWSRKKFIISKMDFFDSLNVPLHPLKSAMNGDDISEIKRLSEVLTHASHSLASTMYQQSSASGCQQGTCGNEGGWQQPSSGSDDDVVDADYQEVSNA
jgi:molecular chaperone DnaK